MAFTSLDYFDMLRLLSEHPEWRGELRRVLFPADFESLPEIVRDAADVQRRTAQIVHDLVQAQERTEGRLNRVEEALTRLAEAQQRTEGRLSRVEEALARLAEAQQRTEDQVRALGEAQERTEGRLSRVEEALTRLAEAQQHTDERVAEMQRHTDERFQELAEIQKHNETHFANLDAAVHRLQTDVGHLRGRDLERTYAEGAAGYFAGLIKRPRALRRDALADLAEEAFSGYELRDLLRVDLVVRGRLPGKGETPEVLLAVEISATLDEGDVERAVRRAGLLRRAGYTAIPMIAGPDATLDALDAARSQSVATLRDGSVLLWEDALAAWAASPGPTE